MNSVLVILDDDPTGVQTVHDVNVYTAVDVSTLVSAFRNNDKLFFILTNSRAFSSDDTIKYHRMLMKNIHDASKITGRSYSVISRGDSTLRGHYPLEMDVISESISLWEGKETDAELLIPFFMEGGRHTVDCVHMLRIDGHDIPVGESEFAKDKTFGFHSSDLRDYIEEKTEGRIAKNDIGVLDATKMDVDEICRLLLIAEHRKRFVVNASSYADLSPITYAYEKALDSGKNLIVRSAASFVKSVGHIKDIPYLDSSILLEKEEKHGILVIVGSHVELTTKQLEQLHDLDNIEFVEFNQHRILEQHGLEDEVSDVSKKLNSLISEGKDVVVHTRRERIDFGDDPEKNLEMSTKISDALVDVVCNLRSKPSCIIAKGGITSCDIGVKALRVKVAKVLGQIAPGVPVWRIGEESCFPGIPYVIFPGNVGNKNTLKEVVQKLRRNV